MSKTERNFITKVIIRHVHYYYNDIKRAHKMVQMIIICTSILLVVLV